MLSEDDGPLGAGANIFTGVKKLVLSQLQGFMFKGKWKGIWNSLMNPEKWVECRTLLTWTCLKTKKQKAEIKEVFDDLHVRTGIPRKVFNFLAKSAYTGDGYETIQKNSELEEAYEAINRVSL